MPDTNPRQADYPGIFVTGTDTGVGKTHVSARLLRFLADQGIETAPRKPVESGVVSSGGLTDAQRLLAASGADIELSRVCPFPLRQPLAPDRAARLQGIEISLEELIHCCVREDENRFVLVEGAGGVLSPITADGDNADLAVALGFPALLVAEDRLGCINQVLLSMEALGRRGVSVLGVVLNAVTSVAPAGMDNREDLRRLTDAPITSCGHGEPAPGPGTGVRDIARWLGVSNRPDA